MKKLIYSIIAIFVYSISSLIAQVIPGRLSVVNHSRSDVNLTEIVANNLRSAASCAASPLLFNSSLLSVSPGAVLVLDPASPTQIASPRRIIERISFTEDRDGFDFCSGAVVGSPFIYQSGAEKHRATVVQLSPASATVVIEDVK